MNISIFEIICIRFVTFTTCKLYLNKVLLAWKKSLWLEQRVNLEEKMNKVLAIKLSNVSKG